MPQRSSLFDAPIDPMLAKLAETLPTTGDLLYEPKWDGVRAIVVRDAQGVRIQGRDGQPLNVQLPELEKELLAQLPRGCVLDGELVIAGPAGLEIDALHARLQATPIHIPRLTKKWPASFVAFDLLAAGGASVMALPQRERRARLERLLGSARAPLVLTPMTTDPAVAADWLQRFVGAGLDGVVAKPAGASYQPGKRALLKVKNLHTADCVVAGLRWHKGAEDAVGTLLLGLHDGQGRLQHVGVAADFSAEQRQALAAELAPLRLAAGEPHPWQGEALTDPKQHLPGATNRWNAGQELPWVPLRPERVVEVQAGQLLDGRFREATRFLRWREDKPAASCDFTQFEVAAPAELATMFVKKRPE